MEVLAVARNGRKRPGSGYRAISRMIRLRTDVGQSLREMELFHLSGRVVAFSMFRRNKSALHG